MSHTAAVGNAGQCIAGEARPQRPRVGLARTSIPRTMREAVYPFSRRPAMALLDGKVAIITGASKGIGRALSLVFAREGAAVVCAARSADLVKETADLVQKAGGRAIAATCEP